MSDPTNPRPTESKKKKTLKRTLASCVGCRRRRTRCDRVDPCSECYRRDLPCSYEGASAPSIAARRHFNQLDEREQYIQQLEARLEALEKSSSSPCRASTQLKLTPTLEVDQNSAETKIDFSSDDLAYHLSQITLGPRVQSTKSDHPLRTELEALLHSSPPRPTHSIFLHQQAFKMSLIPNGPPISLERLQATLPPSSELTELASQYFQTLGLLVPCIEPSSWPEVVFNCYQSLPSNPQPELIHQLVAVLTVAGLGLLRRVDVHKLQTTHCDTNLQHQQIALAHHWFHLALNALTQPDQGSVLTRPTIWGIRAMALLSNVELAPDDLDHGIFFWGLTTNLASMVGLFQEPPGFDQPQSMIELESRRQLAAAVLEMDGAGGAMSARMRPPINFEYHTVKLPGTVGCELASDGWPTDILLATRKAFAMLNPVRCGISMTMLSGRLASYDEVLKLEHDLRQVEESLPKRLQVEFSPDGRSMSPKVLGDFQTKLMCYGLWKRISHARVKLHRPFLFPKQFVGETERSRHLRELEIACRRHLLMAGTLPHSYLMHPLVIYTYMTTAIAASIALIICPNLFDSSFFIPELQKLRDILELAQQTIACTLAQKSKMMLEYLIERARGTSHTLLSSEARVSSSQRSSPGEITSGVSPRNSGTESSKRKSTASTFCHVRDRSVSLNQFEDRRIHPIRPTPIPLPARAAGISYRNTRSHSYSEPARSSAEYSSSVGSSNVAFPFDSVAMRNMSFNFSSPLPSSINHASIRRFSDVDTSPSEESHSWMGDSVGGVECGNIFDPHLLDLFTSQPSQSNLPLPGGNLEESHLIFPF